MSNYVTGPTTFEQIRWSAATFRRETNDDADYIPLYTPEFRRTLLETQDADSVKQLLRFVNKWGFRVSYDKGPGIASAITQAAPHLNPLSGSALEFDDLRCATLDVIERAYDSISAADGVGPSTTSLILALLNPALFVMWNRQIRNAYFPNDKPNGATYAQFLTIMRMAALSITADARSQHGIDDPAGRLSADLGIEPPFSLAKFIDEYNWLTLERAMAQQEGNAVAV
ncbi:MAG: hypothetical protein J4G13_09080 [Dehalococcoidia bacterium]|nr:hypothetical protein [Dehalococcoidia bacterium]